MKLADLKLGNKTIEIAHPDSGDVLFSVVCRHQHSQEYNVRLSEYSKSDSITFAAAVAEAAVIEVVGVDDVDKSQDSISSFLRDPDFYWVVLQIAQPYLEQKKSLKKG